MLVLIDTWWNVNLARSRRNNKNSSFNRYMVECEYRILKTRGKLDRVLIDTWWNVNSNRNADIAKLTSFNRYMVECESDHSL